MPPIRVVTPEEALTYLESGCRYLDVRTESEFEAGHPPGAFNVPLQQETPAGLELNADFLAVVLGNFPLELPLLIGCQSGGRSRRAAELLAAAGYAELFDMALGWLGNRDAFGRTRPGWCRRGLPVETGQPRDRCAADLSANRIAPDPSNLDAVAK